MDDIQILNRLIKASGVTGNEREVSEVIRDLFSAYSPFVWQDRYGNVFARIGEKKEPEVMIMAHMDEIGLMVTGIEKNGLLHFINVGGVDPRVLPGSEVLVLGTEKIPGVIGAIPPHLTHGKTGEAYPMEGLYLDTGLSYEHVTEKIHVGDYITFAPRDVARLKNGYVSSKTLDDRALILVMLKMMEELKHYRLDCSVVFCASVQEERSGVGAMTGAFGLHPDMAIAIDVHHGITPGCKPFEAYPMDKVIITKGSNIHEKMFSMLMDAAKRINVDVAVDVEMGQTGTDAWDIQVQRGGIPSAIVSPPLRYMHTSVETIDLGTLEKCGKVISEFLKVLDGKWEEKLCLDD